MVMAAGCNKTEQQTGSTPESTKQSTQQNSNTSSDTQKSASKTYTMAQVQAGNSASNCLTIVSGSVYNLTDWVNKHPGGAEAIKSMCGKESTDAFVKQHGSSAKAKAALANYLVGELAQ